MAYGRCEIVLSLWVVYFGLAGRPVFLFPFFLHHLESQLGYHNISLPNLINDCFQSDPVVFFVFRFVLYIFGSFWYILPFRRLASVCRFFTAVTQSLPPSRRSMRKP